MLAVRWHAQGDVRVDDVPPPPPPRDDQVQLRVLACGICGTDLEEYRDGPLFIPVNPHPVTGVSAPVTLGHEVVGEVVAVPPGSALEMGVIVAVDGLSSCGHCEFCVDGRPNLCAQLVSIGLMEDGGLAEFVNVPAKGCYPLPSNVGPDEGVLIETLSVAMRAIDRAQGVRGKTVLVIGAGAVGLLVLQAAIEAGASGTTICDPDSNRRALAIELGATAALVPDELPAAGAQVVFECAGHPAAFESAISAVAVGGSVVVLGIDPHQPGIDLIATVSKELTILGSLSHVYNTDFKAAVDLVARGGVRLKPMISGRVPLERAVTDGIQVLERPGNGVIKLVVTP